MTKFLVGQIHRYQLVTEKMANPASAVYTYFMDNLSGSIERITYYNSENGYTVLRLRPEVSRGLRIPGLSYDGLITVVGNLPELSPGEHLRLQGTWDTHIERRVRCASLVYIGYVGVQYYPT